jgi:hypothetical protein
VGVVLLLALTTVAMGGLTAAVGEIIDDQTSHADAASVATEFDAALRPTETTGHRAGRVSFTEGQLRTVPRDIHILNRTGVRATIDADALVYRAGDRRVAYVGGAILRGPPGRAWMQETPPIATGKTVAIFGVPRLGDARSLSGSGEIQTTLRTNVSHRRVSLGPDAYAVAIETATPGAFEQVASRHGGYRVADLDNDSVSSAIINVSGRTEGYLVVHEMRLEVTDG